MEKLKKIIISDTSFSEYVVKTKLTDEQFDEFFKNLNEGKVAFPKNQAAQYIKLVKELGMNFVEERIDAIFLEEIVSTLSDEKPSSDIDSMYKTISKRIETINPELISNLPDFILVKLFKDRPNFATEDDFAMYLLKNEIGKKNGSELWIHLFTKVSFEHLSHQVINQVVDYVGVNPILINNFVAGYKKQNSKKVIRVMQIYPALGPEPNPSIKFNFSKLNKENEHCSIEVDIYSDIEFLSILLIKKDILLPYDILIIGGRDGFGTFTNVHKKGFTNVADTIKSVFQPFIQKGGKILFLHNNIYMYPWLTGELIGLKWDGTYRSQIEVENQTHEVFNVPFTLKSPINIFKTHVGGVMFKENMNFRIPFNSMEDLNYYQERLDKGFALCEAGHAYEDHALGESEEKLIYNILYRMSNN